MTVSLPRRDRLQAVANFIAAKKQARVSPAETVAALIADYRATRKLQPSGNTLRIVGLQVSCTWSEDAGLLEAWSRRVTIELMRLDGRCE